MFKINNLKKIIGGFIFVLSFFFSISAIFALLGLHSRVFFFHLFGLITPLIVTTNVLLLFFWFLLTRKINYLSLISIFFNIEFILSMYNPSFKNKEDAQIGIFSLNIQSFRYNVTSFVLSEIKNTIKKNDIGIINLQEVGFSSTNNEKKFYSKFPEFKYRYLNMPNRGFGLLTMSKYEILKAKTFSFKDTKNSFMWTDLVIKKDTLRVFNLHLQTTNLNQNHRKINKSNFFNIHYLSSTINAISEVLELNYKTRLSQLDVVCNEIENSPYPIILSGDLNSIPSSYIYEKISKLLDDGFKSGGNGIINSISSDIPMRIDYIFSSRIYKCVDYFDMNLLISDHRPTIAKFKKRN